MGQGQGTGPSLGSDDPLGDAGCPCVSSKNRAGSLPVSSWVRLFFEVTINRRGSVIKRLKAMDSLTAETVTSEGEVALPGAWKSSSLERFLLTVRLSPKAAHNISVRRDSLHWTLHNLRAMKASVRTSEIALMAIDHYFKTQRYSLKDHQLACLACIRLALKLEGDCRETVTRFLGYVMKILKVPLEDLNNKELEIFSSLPDEFCLIPTHSELFLAGVKELGLEAPGYEGWTPVLYAGLDLYVSRGHELGLVDHFRLLLIHAKLSFPHRQCILELHPSDTGEALANQPKPVFVTCRSLCPSPSQPPRFKKIKQI